VQRLRVQAATRVCLGWSTLGHRHERLWLKWVQSAAESRSFYSIKGQVSVRPSIYARNSRTAAFKVSGRQMWPNGRLDAAELLTFLITCD
jgi:hypothetical protein